MSFEPIISPIPEDPAEVLARLGTVLVEGGTIDRRTLDRAGRVAAETGGRLDHVLTQLGLVSERGLAEALAQLLGAPLVEARDYPDAPLFLDQLKVKFLRKVRALPIAATNGRATLAMADPLDLFTRNAVAAALGHPVMVAVAVRRKGATARRCSTKSFPTPSRPKRTPSASRIWRAKRRSSGSSIS